MYNKLDAVAITHNYFNVTASITNIKQLLNCYNYPTDFLLSVATHLNTSNYSVTYVSLLNIVIAKSLYVSNFQAGSNTEAPISILSMASLATQITSHCIDTVCTSSQ